MEDYLHTIYLKSSDIIDDDDIEKFSALLQHEKGVESFRISSEGVYLEYNAYLYTQSQTEEILCKNGFRKKKDQRSGFVMKRIRNLAESNKKTYGNRTPDCCQ